MDQRLREIKKDPEAIRREMKRIEEEEPTLTGEHRPSWYALEEALEFLTNP